MTKDKEAKMVKESGMATYLKNDTRFNVWVVEAKMSDGKWYPMPQWGAGNLRRDALDKCFQYALRSGMKWAMDREYMKLSRRIRARKYRPCIPLN